jgi:hypothetical protein
MADKFWAVTKIQFGKRTEDGSQDGKYERVVFQPNEEVTGLSKEDMKDLWQAGALTRERPAEAKDEEETPEETQAPQGPKKATSPKAPADVK